MSRTRVRRPRSLSPERLEDRSLLTTIVALIDTGVDLSVATNPSYSKYYDLADGINEVTGQTVAADGNSVVADTSYNGGPGHGATVAKNILAGMSDVQAQPGASGASLEILPIVDSNSSGQEYLNAALQGIYDAITRHANVINLSMEFLDTLNDYYVTQFTNAFQDAASNGVTVVVAAGNNGDTYQSQGVNIDPGMVITGPSNDPYVNPNITQYVYPAYIHSTNSLVVGSVDASNNSRDPISNWGPNHVDLGVSVASGHDPATSYAAGYASGVTGAIASLDSSLSGSSLVSFIKANAQTYSTLQGVFATGGVISPANAVSALNLGQAPPTATSLGQDGHDYIGSGAQSSGPDGYQDIHIALSNIPSSKTIQWIDITGYGGGEWRYNGAYGTDKAVLRNYYMGATSADLYMQPYQNETGRQFTLTIYYTDSTSAIAYTNGVNATYHLAMSPTATSLGQDGHDYIGSGAQSSGPDGYQDIHVALDGLDPTKTVQWIDITGYGGGEWRYNGTYGTDKAVLVNYTAGGLTGDLYMQPYQDETGRQFTVTVYYTDSSSTVMYTNGVFATHQLADSSAPVATSVGQDGHDYIGSGAQSTGPDGYQDIHVTLSNLPSSKTIQWIDITGYGGGEWRYNGAYGTDKAVLVNYDPGGTTADLFMQPYQNETGRQFTVTIYYTDSSSTTSYTNGVYATYHLADPPHGAAIRAISGTTPAVVSGPPAFSSTSAATASSSNTQRSESWWTRSNNAGRIYGRPSIAYKVGGVKLRDAAF